MARITCAISGIRFQCSYLEAVSISHTEGYFHPIFAAPYKTLDKLFAEYTRGKLSSNDSYLLFIAYLHSSGSVSWSYPASCNPNDIITRRLVDANITKLVTVLEKSACIRYPGFKQPSYNITSANSALTSIPAWIQAWEDNIEQFLYGRHSQNEVEKLQAIENRLSRLILSGSDTSSYSHIVAEWACNAAEFPADKADRWKKLIRSSYSTAKMFATPLAELREIKDYCECNIEVGTIHFHSLQQVLTEGISRHVNFLGAVNTSDLGYTLLPLDITKADKNTAEIIAISEKAPSSEPVRTDYTSSIDFLRARLAYKVASNLESVRPKATVTQLAPQPSITPTTGDTDNDSI